jgi:hypothetical protein
MRYKLQCMLLLLVDSCVVQSLQASMRNSLLQQFAVRLFEGQLHNVGEQRRQPQR